MPWQEWADKKYITLVDSVQIHPDLLTDWLSEQALLYNIIKIAMDNFRYTLFSQSLRKIGFDAKEYKNVKLVQPSDIMKVASVIDSCFADQCFVWGDNPPLRWATNNTKKIPSGKKQGTDTGNYYYGKIEAKSRKTDPFMGVVASMTIEDELLSIGSSFDDLPVIIG